MDELIRIWWSKVKGPGHCDYWLVETYNHRAVTQFFTFLDIVGKGISLGACMDSQKGLLAFDIFI